MAASSRTRAEARAWPLLLDPFCGCLIAIFLTPSIDAARPGGGAVASDASLDADLALRASAQLTLESAAARSQRGRDLRTASEYIDSVNVQDCHHLGNIKDILEEIEDIRVRLMSFYAARDPRHRQIRRILRDLEVQGDALKAMAGKLEAEGEVDDGGDELPTQRDNICRGIRNYDVQAEFAEMVQLFCQWLDGVRKAVNAGEDEEPVAYSVSGLFNALTEEPDYRKGNTGRDIKRVLGEERRWVSKHLEPRLVGTGNGLPSPEGTNTEFRQWAPHAWQAQIWKGVGGDTAAMLLQALNAAQNTLVSIAAEGDLSLGSVRTRIQRLEVVKGELADAISSTDPAFRERFRDVLREIETRVDALRALAARKLQEGEVDSSSELLPSQRDNICTKLEAFFLEEDFREDVQKICGTFDRLHVGELERGKGGFELLGRIAAVRRRPGYSDTLVATELDHFILEGWGWVFGQEAVADA